MVVINISNLIINHSKEKIKCLRFRTGVAGYISYLTEDLMDSSNLTKYADEAANMRPETVVWWKPEEGEAISGSVTYIGEQESKFGVQDIIKVKVDDTVYIKAQTAAIARAIREQAIAKGDIVTIKFFSAEEKDGRTYKNFGVLVHERAPDEVPF